ncbi:MAG: T9SS type A sorting domain-containing protein [Bacteroidota bacterium]|nr:T9SS type A sorting domain-containing protein [Bacteroidota bacterium]
MKKIHVILTAAALTGAAVLVSQTAIAQESAISPQPMLSSGINDTAVVSGVALNVYNALSIPGELKSEEDITGDPTNNAVVIEEVDVDSIGLIEYINGNSMGTEPSDPIGEVVLVNGEEMMRGIDPFKYVISDNVSGGVKSDNNQQHSITGVDNYNSRFDPKRVNLQPVKNINSSPEEAGQSADAGSEFNVIPNEVIMYPNPANGMVNIPTGNHSNGTVRILNMQGQQVIQADIQGQSWVTIDIRDIEPGAYLVSVPTQEGEQLSKLIVTQ